MASLVVATTLGPRPTSAAEFFAIQQSNPFAALLRGDFVLMIFLLGAYLGIFPTLWWNLRRASPLAATFATLFTGIGIAILMAIPIVMAVLFCI